MPQTDFNNSNLFRTYPLVHSTAAINYCKYLSFARFILRNEITYTPGVNGIYFYGTLNLNSQVITPEHTFPAGISFLFSCDSKEFIHSLFIASFGNSPQIFQSAQLELISKRSAHTAGDFDAYPYDPLLPTGSAEGVISFGDPADITISTELFTNSLPVEPCTVLPVQEPAGGPGRGRVRIYNKARTKYSPDPDCAHVKATPAQESTPYVLQYVADGPVKFSAGHNLLIDALTNQGVITFSGDVGAGNKGPICEDIPISATDSNKVIGPGGTAELFERKLDGALTCKQVARSLNGAQGPDVRIRAFDGTQVASYPQLNRVVVGITGAGSAACPSFNETAQVACIPQNAWGINCGDNNVESTCPPEPNNKVGYNVSDIVGYGMMSYATASAIVEAPALLNRNICGDPCEWVFTSGGFELLNSGCVSPCGCLPPTVTGGIKEGDKVKTSCSELTETPFLIRNADFIATPFYAGWDIYGNVTLITSDPNISSHDLPVVQLKSENNITAQIRQKYVPITKGRTYRIELDAEISEGELVIAFVDQQGEIVFQARKQIQKMGPVVFNGFTPPSATLDVIIAAKPTVTANAVVKFARLGLI